MRLSVMPTDLAPAHLGEICTVSKRSTFTGMASSVSPRVLKVASTPSGAPLPAAAAGARRPRSTRSSTAPALQQWSARSKEEQEGRADAPSLGVAEEREELHGRGGPGALGVMGGSHGTRRDGDAAKHRAVASAAAPSAAAALALDRGLRTARIRRLDLEQEDTADALDVSGLALRKEERAHGRGDASVGSRVDEANNADL